MNKALRIPLMYLLLLFCFYIFCLVAGIIISIDLNLNKIYSASIAWQHSVLYFTTYFLPGNLGILCVLLSFIIPHFIEERDPNRIREILIPLVITLIIATGMESFFQQVTMPKTRKAVENTIFKSNVSGELYQRAQKALEESQFNAAVDLLRQYLTYHPDDSKTQQLLFDSERHLTNQIQKQSMPEKKDSPLSKDEIYYSIPVLIMLADKEFPENPYLAYHYLLIAEKIESSHAQVKNRLKEVRDYISRANLTSSEMSNNRLYRNKQLYLSSLTNGDPITAYYGFKSLVEKHPNQEDLQKYYYISLGSLRKQAFFIDEAIRNLRLKGTSPVLFLNNTEEYTQIISADKLSISKEGSYWQNVKIWNITDQGIITIIEAPYGKTIQDQLNLRGLSPYANTADFYPKYIKGSARNVNRFQIPLKTTIEDIAEIPSTFKDLSNIEFYQLIKLLGSNEYYPIPESILKMELLVRLSHPFLFFTLCTLMSYLAYHYRKDSWIDLFKFGLISLPIIIFAGFQIIKVFSLILRILFSVSLLHLSLSISLLLVSVFFFISLFWIFFKWVKELA